MSLTDTKIKSLKPSDKQYRVRDSGGLFIQINTNGSKLWRYRYIFAGKEKMISLGSYPEISLLDARTKRDEAKKNLANNLNPSVEKSKQKLEFIRNTNNTFEVLSNQFLELLFKNNLSKSTIVKNRYFANKLYPTIGRLPINQISTQDILPILNSLVKTNNRETAKRVCAYANRVFNYSINIGISQNNPATNLSKTIPAPIVKHRSAVIKNDEIKNLLIAIDSYNGIYTTKYALKLLPYFFVRPGELRHAEWSEFNFEEKLWSIPAHKMKMNREHLVPLSNQTLELLNELKQIITNSKYLFPSIRTHLKPMSENTMNAGLKSMGYDGDTMTAHGFRSIASTHLHQSEKWDSLAIEMQLAHKDKNVIRDTYNKADYINTRTNMMQWWSDYLDGLKNSN